MIVVPFLLLMRKYAFYDKVLQVQFTLYLNYIHV